MRYTRDDDIQELLERTRQIDRMKKKRGREIREQERRELSAFQRAKKRVFRKKTISDLSQEFTIGM